MTLMLGRTSNQPGWNDVIFLSSLVMPEPCSGSICTMSPPKCNVHDPPLLTCMAAGILHGREHLPDQAPAQTTPFPNSRAAGQPQLPCRIQEGCDDKLSPQAGTGQQSDHRQLSLRQQTQQL